MVKQYKHKGKKKNIVLEEAKELALRFKDEFKYFNYNNVGLKYYRWYHKPFREWATKNGIYFQSHVNKPGKRGFQDALFYPFRYDENGKIEYAVIPAEESSCIDPANAET